MVNGSTIGGGASEVEGRLNFLWQSEKSTVTVVNVMVAIGDCLR